MTDQETIVFLENRVKVQEGELHIAYSNDILLREDIEKLRGEYEAIKKELFTWQDMYQNLAAELSELKNG